MSNKPNDMETYQVIFCTRNSNVTSGVANLNVVRFYVNWAAILPIDKYIKYSCSFVFKSENYAGLLTSNGFVNVDIGRTQIYDGTGERANLGMIYPVYLSNVAPLTSFYNSTNNDNNPVIIYPSQNIVTVTLNTFQNTAMANMPHYSLILNLSPCI